MCEYRNVEQAIREIKKTKTKKASLSWDPSMISQVLEMTAELQNMDPQMIKVIFMPKVVANMYQSLIRCQTLS